MAFIAGVQNPMQRRACPGCGTTRRANFGLANCGNCNAALAPEPFVGVYDVGQGNCNVLVGTGGRPLAFFDLGYSTAGKRQPQPPLKLCLCSNPVVILSHWDQDHYQYYKQDARALSLTWITPEQAASPIAKTTKAKIRAAGGALYVWPKGKRLANQGEIRLQHMNFSWGWVERCVGDPTKKNQVNSSGLVAYVCVEDGRVPGIVQRAQDSAANQPTLAQRKGPARGSVAAAGLVNGLLAANVLLPRNYARVERLARPVATALGGSQTNHRRSRLPPAECASAAVVAANARLVNNANRNAIILALAGCLPTMQLWNAALAGTIRGEIADATIAAAAESSYRFRARVAAGQLSMPATTPAAFENISRAVDRGVVAPPAIRTGLARFPAQAKFALLTGDANYSVMPSMRRRGPRPKIVSTVAMHHGAIFEDGDHLHANNVPFAPGSVAAKSVVRSRRHRLAPSVITTVSEFGMAMARHRGRGLRRKLRVQASRAARAAALAVLAVDRNPVGHVNLGMAYAAAAAAVAALLGKDSLTIGLAACLANFNVAVSKATGVSPIETAIDLADAAMTRARQGGGKRLSWDEVREHSKGAILARLVGLVPFLSREVVALGYNDHDPQNAGYAADVAYHRVALNYKEAEKWHVHERRKRNPDYKAKKTHATRAKAFKNRLEFYNSGNGDINDVTTAAVAVVLRSKRKKAARHTTATATRVGWESLGAGGTNLGTLAASLRQVLQGGWDNNFVGAQYFAGEAARLAAGRIVAYRLGASHQQLIVGVEAGRDPVRRTQARYALGPRRHRRERGAIAYSYGVDRKRYQHEYDSLLAGDIGHPNPLAILTYEALGWLRRGNTSAHARHPDPDGDRDRSHPKGNLWHGWESQARHPGPHGQVTHTCPDCGGATDFCR